MKILVCISVVPDTTTKINFSADGKNFVKDGVTFIVNPYDEWYALVRALELKESQGGTVTVVNVGTESNDAVIRKALAIGADDAVRINTEPLDCFQVGKLISDYANGKDYDLILTGKETIDYNSSMVGGIIAENMQLPYVALASSLEVDGSSATLHRDVEGGKEVVEANLPMVVSATKGMAEQRIPNMRGIMQARSKPLEVVELSADAKTSVQQFNSPPDKSECKYIDADNPGELWNLLHNEAKVI